LAQKLLVERFLCTASTLVDPESVKKIDNLTVCLHFWDLRAQKLNAECWWNLALKSKEDLAKGIEEDEFRVLNKAELMKLRHWPILGHPPMGSVHFILGNLGGHVSSGLRHYCSSSQVPNPGSQGLVAEGSRLWSIRQVIQGFERRWNWWSPRQVLIFYVKLGCVPEKIKWLSLRLCYKRNFELRR